MSDQERKEVEMKVFEKIEDIKGVYANALTIRIQDRDVILDFYEDIGIKEQSLIQRILVSRIILPHYLLSLLPDFFRSELSNWQNQKDKSLYDQMNRSSLSPTISESPKKPTR